MNKLPANLRRLMAAEGISENQLARDTGVPQPTIHRILAGRVADPRDGTLRPLAEHFGVTVEELRTTLPIATQAIEPANSRQVKAVEDASDLDKDQEVMVAEVDIRVSAGSGISVPEFIETSYGVSYRLSWFQKLGVRQENVRSMKVAGDSMERTLFHDDRIAINLADNKRIIDGKVYVFATGGVEPDIKIKRLFKTADGRIRVVSDNPDKTLYPDELLSAEEVSNITLIGRVIDRSGRGGL